MIRKTLAAAAIVAGVTAGAAGPALAEHVHYVIRTDRDGETTHCRQVAHGQTSKDATDPGGHEFHEQVHWGRPGTDANGTTFGGPASDCDTYIGAPRS